ncbi:MAG: futalosine hydrolase [Nitrospirae bacterium]|nr:futalosine hydrolase [Nitrospirota bacterium]
MIVKESCKNPVGLISAVKLEGTLILRYMKTIREGIPQGFNLYKGKIQNKSVVYIISGIGKTNASIGTMFLFEKFSPKLIINFGVGGAYPSSGLAIGDIAVAEKEIYGDEGVYLKDGFHPAEVTGIPLLVKAQKRYFNKFQLDKKLIKKAVSISRITHHVSRITVKSGPFLTVSTSTGTLKRAKELEKKFGTICENMEGASIAHICTLYGIPMVEIRGISNIVKDRNKKEWDVKLASENCQKAVIEFLKNYNL